MTVHEFRRSAPEEIAKEHITCPAICLGCKHEWIAVQEAGTNENCLECPSCHALKGMLKQFVYFNNAPIYTCMVCQGFLWSIINKHGAATACCANCGKLNPLIEAFDQAEHPK